MVRRRGDLTAPTYARRVLSIDQLAAYHRDGFVVVEEFVPPAVCEQLQARAEEIVEAFEPTEQHTVFTTDEQERASNREFLDSGAGIWCFFEAEAHRPGRAARHRQGAQHQQDRPRHARPRPRVRGVQLHTENWPRSLPTWV